MGQTGKIDKVGSNMKRNMCEEHGYEIEDKIHHGIQFSLYDFNPCPMMLAHVLWILNTNSTFHFHSSV